MKHSLRSCSALYKAVPLLVVGGVFSVVSAHAQLTDRYSFDDGTATDSVNATNSGTVSGNATIAGGMLTTTGSNNTSYVSLPTTIGAGITGDFSIETFTTNNAGANNTSYSTLFSFGSQDHPQVDGPSTNFLLFNANRPNAGGSSANFRQSQTTGTEQDIHAAPLLNDGLEHDILLTYVAATKTVSIYSGGTLAATATLNNPFSLATAAAGGFNGINGHSPFPDNSYNGSTDDFRLYSSALTAAQASAVDALGADPTNAQIGAITGVVPEPSTWMAALVGLGALVGVRRFRRSMV